MKLSESQGDAANMHSLTRRALIVRNQNVAVPA
jgi:hypothetical protein